jgi:hypothetical protein
MKVSFSSLKDKSSTRSLVLFTMKAPFPYLKNQPTDAFASSEWDTTFYDLFITHFLLVSRSKSIQNNINRFEGKHTGTLGYPSTTNLYRVFWHV